jgi:hypothetical protein
VDAADKDAVSRMAKSSRRHANCAVAVCEADKDDASDDFDAEVPVAADEDDEAGSTKHQAAARAERSSHRIAIPCADEDKAGANAGSDGGGCAASQHEAIDHSENDFKSSVEADSEDDSRSSRPAPSALPAAVDIDASLNTLDADAPSQISCSY